MSGGSGLVYPLQGNQLLAADPEDNVWLSASAGTGKTQVLSARVLRLLLRPEVDPSQILCLTFTKAGAAEMANRINAVLASWVRLPEGALAKELGHLGADFAPDTIERARSLFARVLDCPGGGLRIDTIHAFAQFLISNFPEEAGLAPGIRVMDDRSRDLLAREVLSDLITSAEAANDRRLLEAIAAFVRRKDPSALQTWLMRAAESPELWHGRDAWQSPMDARVRQMLGIPADADEAWANDVLGPDVFPDHLLAVMLPVLDAWKAKTGEESAAFIRQWLASDLTVRRNIVALFRKTLLKADGEPRLMQTPEKVDPGFRGRQEEIAETLRLHGIRLGLLTCAEVIASALEIGRAFAIRWDERKAREGLVDFGDLIRKAASLLDNSEAADWIRYKLDRHFDHILIDEAQDTNRSQWDIIFALIDDFFSGEGARGDKLRTIFTVGDYKQAIFGFQGTSPENFARAKLKVEARIMQAREGIRAARINRREPGWQDLDLGQSFRTANVVLDFVNRAIALLGFEAFGLPTAPALHEGAERPGLVTLWPPVIVAAGERDMDEADEGKDDDPAEDSGRDWLPRHDTVLADKIAQQVQHWLSPEGEPFVLEKGNRRHAQAGDIMVLVRQRKELAAQIVARLHARGVPVAGVDRLRLGAPLAVKDLLAALRFAAQPLDDLSLANLLASPLIGWSQDDILAYVPRPERVRLWDHLRREDAPAAVQQVADKLRELLRLADYQTPQALISWLLNGPWHARARLIERLGNEANDPLDELVNAAFAFEAEHWPSLVGFLQWFDAGTGDLKRDADSSSGQVRVMTVHGSKGLQAPIVILADATGAPGDAGALSLEDNPFDLESDLDRLREVPLPPLSKHERLGRIADAANAANLAARQEHWRLLYVAMTRAEEALFIGGALNRKEAKVGVPHEESWYARLAPLFEGEAVDDPVWLWRKEWGHRAEPLVPESDTAAPPTALPELPRWVSTPIGPEPRPPRPLAPSSVGEEAGAEPPLPPEAVRIAARRGSLIHRLLERLPDVSPSERGDEARAWLARQAGDLDEPVREDMLAAALAVLEHPDFAALFSPAALAEVPLAATVGGVVVAGTADRLLVEETRVVVVDFKTTRRPPANAGDIPAATLRQMAAYVAALEAIYPDRAVRAAVLYTHAPVLLELGPDVLAPHKQQLDSEQQSYWPLAIE
ncbi:double-strand break repair helicase AddA [Porphyrobacter sp. LM 6]|uniref:double-strand break repair helicase AddA n=1 Tax=Porphyrobacter sp. LM 6 TaxID=1896196 RepID=UPI00084753B2|nr:double-strand break repair helicase AddA [Porphyrobacter sp. LM 6]AOL94656.1 DNA helicase/exodeoxyribonuclease V, subunit A [Porphyrobacter sp. LM 6]